ncbi:sensor histidine kinase [Paenibacillus hexagrammi]|uniref:Histidine kinase n=1 Tax=Paenibacillus hexagrammi TaxID=2908839 RepID=A0ABY3SCW5_9BACL|nr:histidine kinase [Paenibacillus sp. YPD9-1]UJF31834.1 histidine kinase [Paenibacillus sp. YPD9-1]
MPKAQLEESKPFHISFDGERLLVVNKYSQRAGINLAVVLPEDELLQGLQYFRVIVSFIPILVLAVLLLCMILIRRLLLQPIQQLLSVIRKIKQGDMKVRLPLTESVDFSIIYQSFNGMVEEITDLKIGVYEERLRTQKAELKQLQSQINPHFYMNTMNVLYQLADLKQVDLVKKTVQHLVKYFRFSMSTHGDLIPLFQELDHIRNYLEIQKMRFQDAFEFKIDIDEELRLIAIPPLIVQPFVENAMIHGYSVKENEPFQLTIRVDLDSQNNQLFHIQVQDNGKGFSEDMLEKLTGIMYAPNDEDKHIGIWNVKKRIAMRYEDRLTGVSFRNADCGGAVIDIILPIIRNEE